MLIKVINPNTTRSMTDKIGDCARSDAAAGTTIQAVNPTMGPASIESHYDEALAVPGLLTEIAAGERARADGYVVACFGDPGLDAAREIARGSVIGIAEAAMHTATLIGRSFSVVTTLHRTRGRAWELAHRYGVAQSCRNVRACEIPVLDLEIPGSTARGNSDHPRPDHQHPIRIRRSATQAVHRPAQRIRHQPALRPTRTTAPTQHPPPGRALATTIDTSPARRPPATDEASLSRS